MFACYHIYFLSRALGLLDWIYLLIDLFTSTLASLNISFPHRLYAFDPSEAAQLQPHIVTEQLLTQQGCLSICNNSAPKIIPTLGIV